MFSLFRSNINSSKRTSGSTRKSSGGSVSLKSQRDGVMEKRVMEGAERELYQYDQPKQELGMSDLIKNHESGTRFMYAAITGKESEDIGSKMRRLVSFQPALKKKALNIDNLPIIELFRETETFPLDQIINPGRQGKKTASFGKYVRVSDAITVYGAVVSPDCNFTKVQVGISDNRLLTDRMVKSFTATTNMMTKGNLALPYCIPVNDADQLILTVSRERAFLEEGRQWGAIQIQLILEFSNFPAQYDNQPVAAMNMLPSTTLESPLNNPNNIDISVLNQDRKKLADLYLDGEIADENDPIQNKTTAVKYAKSYIAGPANRGKKIDSAVQEWSFLSEKRTKIDADQNSIEPSIDDIPDAPMSDTDSFEQEQIPPRPATPPLKSAMKSSSPSSDESPLTKKVGFENDIKKLSPWQ